ncbi:hypothetical protein [Gluconobacter kanchanaburiensis]|uniref:Uncharacterized protein n=1 Tax=Gluconobacter kanchanaburiensis NBRC 103587 TaxID=1307948 RepID=A0A511B4W5_9PROT|nr:hypothetical protein [Gluconobacter kanchanaburiensis]MBF0861996.1 hypothetical protein [Gluconobacter kanchanaburiensis]GBR67652.1 hypothetical protein AA103587_0396 [Gluconobacter kanchanaburiensis NBRC 103587]GEK95476.1 hypothetical protein GKA01_06730 [Gluconobacter kanchanaburiensis NBRC 103587]
MGHNYAKPLTVEARMERILSRLPSDWGVRMERLDGADWHVWMKRPDGMEQQIAAPVLVDALEEVWRALR